MVVLFTYLAFLVVVGALLCFKGRQLFFPMISILAFIMAFGTYLAIAEPGTANVIIGLVIGLVFALLARFIYLVGVFISGAIAGCFIGSGISCFIPSNISYGKEILMVVCAILIGILAVKWVDFFISLSTAAEGASLMALPCCFMVMNLAELSGYAGSDALITLSNVNDAMTGKFAEKEALIIVCVTAVLFVIGLIVQLKTNAKMPKNK